ncbi:MAG TPA: endo-1,4-beta-xylanase [Terriglobales bacterium]|nr:endo-1,4-beta-xylanase [Terriglobales bacterium]
MARPFKACSAALPLGEVIPDSVWARNPNQNVTPRPATIALQNGPSQSALQFISQSRVTYKIPAGQEALVGNVVYESSPALQTPRPERPGFALWLRILVDGALRYETVLDHDVPAQVFSVQIAGGKIVTFETEGHLGWDSFYLVNGGFTSETSCTEYSQPIVQEGESSVVVGGAIQQLFPAFTALSVVPVRAYYQGQAQRAELRLRLKAEHQQFPDYEWATNLLLSSPAGSLKQASAIWNVPKLYGPAELVTTLTVNGNQAFQHSRRVSLLPVRDSSSSSQGFGFHTSTAGFAFSQDRTLSLWGAKWGRAYIAWNVVQPSPDRFDFSRIDEVVGMYEQQGLKILGVLGEHAPAWAGNPGPAYYEAWQRYVAATVDRYKGRIQHWDLFNEIDAKYFEGMAGYDADADTRLLRIAAETVRSRCSTCKIICCSTGTSDWLSYDRRILPQMLPLTDYVSFHPYRYSAPEEKEGFWDFLGEMSSLAKLTSELGNPKPIWATEANWIIGGDNSHSVRNPEMDEHTQAQYVVRANLLALSEGIPFFLHAPVYHASRLQMHADTVSAFAYMSSQLAGAVHVHRLQVGDGVYAVVGARNGSTVGALWALREGAIVALSGVTGLSFFDMYGNPQQFSPQNLALGPAPIYFTASGTSEPNLQILRALSVPARDQLPPWSEWRTNSQSSYEQTPQAFRVTTAITQYAYQLVSPAITVQPASCYRVRLPLTLTAGALSVIAIDAASGERTSPPIFVVSDGLPTTGDAEVRMLPGSSSELKIVIAAGNLAPASSQFYLAGPAEISTCH